MTTKKCFSALLSFVITTSVVIGKENINQGGNKTLNNVPQRAAAANCNEPFAQTDLQINNVRARIFSAGDMWWNLVEAGASAAQYEVPRGSGKTSLFAGSVWIGGYDATGNLKVAGQTYRQQDRNDFFTGPIGVQGGNLTTDVSICNYYDRIWSVTKQQVRDFVSTGVATRDIREWPGNGDISRGELNLLAPFEDVNGDGLYIPDSGDYPRYLLSGEYIRDPNSPPAGLDCDGYIFGDQTLWWVFNDVGNIKKETTSGPMGLEIRAQAFAFQTDDEINNMTFYKYQIINRSNISFDSTYFGWWVDADLGDAFDDYIGCDVNLGLGYCYNGDNDDGGGTAEGYGINPPAVGADFFQGPIGDDGNQIPMVKFGYYNNVNGSPFGNPGVLDDYYQFLTGSWADGIRWSRDGAKGQTPPSSTTPITDFMFPGTTDPAFPGDNWTEASANNPPDDRRFLQSAGPFVLTPGAVNYISVGMIWARTLNGGPLASVTLLKETDRSAQSLFDACFKILDGPDAPNVQITELSNKLILSLKDFNNTRVERYAEVDPKISEVDQPDEELRKFKFQGYMIFQVKDATVNVSDIFDPSKTTASNILSGEKYRLLYQIDLKDTITDITNYYWDPSIPGYRPFKVALNPAEFSGANAGLKHSFVIENDAFTSKPLINHKAYYYIAISYAYNNFKPFDYVLPPSPAIQYKPFKVGRNNIKITTGIPHDASVEYSGLVFNAEIGDGVEVQRLEGQGNAGLFISMKDEDVDKAVPEPYLVRNPVYEIGKGPLNVTVYDPLYVEHGHFEFKLTGVEEDATWSVKEEETLSGDTATTPISQPNSQIIQTIAFDGSGKSYEWGLTADISNTTIEAGTSNPDNNNGFLGSSISFADDSKQWLSGLKDDNKNSASAFNWIRAENYPNLDENRAYEKVIDGTWTAYKLANNDNTTFGPKYAMNSGADNNFIKMGGPNGIFSVDVVFTNDKSKWTRCPVFEMGANSANTEGNALRFKVRKANSVDKEGRPFGNGGDGDAALVSTTGMGWFPGYAVNIETGERLNMAFGENSELIGNNGRDMIWNPTDSIIRSDSTILFGGMHYVYVFNARSTNGANDVPRYDLGQKFMTAYAPGSNNNALMGNFSWVGVPLLTPGQQLLSTEVRVKIRVARLYRQFNTNTDQSTYVNVSGTTTLTRGVTYYVVSGSLTAAFNNNAITYSSGQTITLPIDNIPQNENVTSNGGAVLAPTENGANPWYRFTNDGLEPTFGDAATAKNALSLINVVPNPYYAYSSYDKTTNANWVKITNLPPKCTVSIYTMNGSLVRRYNRDAGSTISGATAGLSQGTEAGSGNYDTSLDWDLKNQKNIPISAGVYLINVKAPGLGERTLKWFGVLRPITLDSY